MSKSAAYMRAMREKIVSRKKKRPKEAYVAPPGTRTRFSRSNSGSGKHARDMIRLEVTKRHQAGESQYAIAKALGIPRTSVENWTTQSTLPVKPTSPYTFARMLAVVTMARNLYRQKFSDDPKHCLWEAVRRTPSMKLASVKVYLSMEAVPSLAGFPLYADQAVQARCEALGRGERARGTDIFDAAPTFSPPASVAPDAPAPSQPAAMPAAKTPAFDRERFLASRYRLQLPRLRL